MRPNQSIKQQNKEIIKDQECNSYVEMKREADNREEWKMAAIQFTD
ncbi:putative transposon-derived protein F52C9.6 [Aphis craccivora]|uniref:Putative transposon-derived protein F52C9.6 n=1 Tax=Aphis craccivora TaxID=307492 RepID=A0A6G0YZZ4_APHCR|nr:putative transposon-derived protein F52C9.6 [Aphis craccivora]